MNDWDEYLVEVTDLIDAREKYQRRLGQVASDIGSESLERFAEELLNTSGYKVSPTTLRSYRWVWEKTKDLQLPEDLPYRVYRELAGTEDPKEWADKIIKEGLSGPEAIRLIRISKGLDKKKTKTIICAQCGNNIEVG